MGTMYYLKNYEVIQPIVAKLNKAKRLLPLSARKNFRKVTERD